MADYPTDTVEATGEPERPCAFVNKSSGERGAAVFVYEQLKKCIGADNVFDLFPQPGKPPAIEEAKAFIAARDPDFLIVAGGDGTVSLGMDIVDAVRAANKIGATAAPVAVLPMGTGNDLSRSLGFGGGYKKPLVKPEEGFAARLKRMYAAMPRKVDRFSVTVELLKEGAEAAQRGQQAGHTIMHPPVEKSDSSDADEREKRHPFSDAESRRGTSQQQQEGSGNNGEAKPAKTPAEKAQAAAAPGVFAKVFTNYFSIGFDARVAEQFGNFRNKNPEMCKTRVANKMWYGCFGCHAMCCADTIPKKQVSLKLDDVAVKVPSGAKAIVVANMITYAGGNVLWSDSRKRFAPPAVDDGMVEVTALEGVWHMVGVGTQTRSAAKIGQGHSIVLYVPADFTMQYDGEPIAALGTLDQVVKVVIEHKGQSLGMELRRSGTQNDEDGEQVAPLHSEQAN